MHPPASVVVELEKTAANTDVLAGTELDQPPSEGVLYLWAASTVNTATLEVPQWNHQPGRTILLRKRTDGIPSIQDDAYVVIPCKKGSRPTIALAGTTGTCHFTALFYPR